MLYMTHNVISTISTVFLLHFQNLLTFHTECFATFREDQFTEIDYYRAGLLPSSINWSTSFPSKAWESFEWIGLHPVQSTVHPFTSVDEQRSTEHDRFVLISSEVQFCTDILFRSKLKDQTVQALKTLYLLAFRQSSSCLFDPPIIHSNHLSHFNTFSDLNFTNW